MDFWLCKTVDYCDASDITSHFLFVLGYLLILKVNIMVICAV